MRALTEVRDKALAFVRILFAARFPVKPTEPVAKSDPLAEKDSNYTGAYYTSDDVTALPEELPDDINALFNMPYLLHLTCLQFFNLPNKTISRFNCVLKISK